MREGVERALLGIVTSKNEGKWGVISKREKKPERPKKKQDIFKLIMRDVRKLVRQAHHEVLVQNTVPTYGTLISIVERNVEN